MPKKATPKRKAAKSTAPKSSKTKTSKTKTSKTKTSKPKDSKPTMSQRTRKESSLLAGVAAVMLVGPPVRTAEFSRVQITLTLSGKKNSVPQCDIRASLDDGPPSESAGFGNAIKPLLMEVLRKLSLAYPGLPTITLGVDSNGDLIPTGTG
jgi:hypothetical protein